MFIFKGGGGGGALGVAEVQTIVFRSVGGRSVGV